MTTPTDQEIIDEMWAASDQANEGSKWPGMSYEEGVAAALKWVVGETETKPFTDQS